MLASERLVVQMTPQQKQRLEFRARAAGLSTSEYVRRWVEEDDLESHRAEIEALLDALERVAPRIMATLDAAIAETEEATAELLRERTT